MRQSRVNSFRTGDLGLKPAPLVFCRPRGALATPRLAITTEQRRGNLSHNTPLTPASRHGKAVTGNNMRLLGLIYPLPDTVVITVAAWVSNTVAFLPCTVCVCVFRAHCREEWGGTRMEERHNSVGVKGMIQVWQCSVPDKMFLLIDIQTPNRRPFCCLHQRHKLKILTHFQSP